MKQIYLPRNSLLLFGGRVRVYVIPMTNHRGAVFHNIFAAQTCLLLDAFGHGGFWMWRRSLLFFSERERLVYSTVQTSDVLEIRLRGFFKYLSDVAVRLYEEATEWWLLILNLNFWCWNLNKQQQKRIIQTNIFLFFIDIIFVLLKSHSRGRLR